jgi:hypothetical protein
MPGRGKKNTAFWEIFITYSNCKQQRGPEKGPGKEACMENTGAAYALQATGGDGWAA